MKTHRREFLSGALGLAAASALPQCASAPKDEPRADAASKLPVPKRPLFKISLAEWSLHRALQKGEVEHLDFPRIAKEEFGLDAVEYVNTFFESARHTAKLRRRCEDLGVSSLLIMCDGLGHLGDADAAARAKAVENHFPWIEAVRDLGGHAIRVNAAGEGPPDEVAKRVAESLVKLAQRCSTHAGSSRMSVIVENHGGLSSNGAWLAGVMRLAASAQIGTLPDFGNFDLGGGKQYDRYQGVRELMPFAHAVSAKSHDFDERGEETSTDYRRMLQIVLDAGYDGYVGIEYEGARLPEREGIAKTKALLERVRAELT